MLLWQQSCSLPLLPQPEATDTWDKDEKASEMLMLTVILRVTAQGRGSVCSARRQHHDVSHLFSKPTPSSSCTSNTRMDPHDLMFQMLIINCAPKTVLAKIHSHTDTHLSHSISHCWPGKFSELIWRTCDRFHGLYYRVSDALNVIDCELHHTEFSLIYSGGLVMYSSERSVQFASKSCRDDRARKLYIFHCFFVRHGVIFLCCVIVHMYLCTKCVY